MAHAAEPDGLDLDELYPNRPKNHGETLPFCELYRSLFNPLEQTKKQPGGNVNARRNHGTRVNPQEAKRAIIRNFISTWREKVGNDIYPALRLIIPEKDKERAMYGLKEKTIAKIIIRLIKINKEAEDAQMLLNWKLPGQRQTVFSAGDFAGRCNQVIGRRAVRSKPSDMTIATVNQKLDELSLTPTEDKQLAIFQQFYNVMNAEEMMWLIRIILRQMKIGATETTFFSLWHPDAEMLFSISSNLRRVCWELSDPNVRLADDEANITLMQCFQPQLAQFQMQSFDRMIARLRPQPDDDEFWIEEKLDGERMQLHMVADPHCDGGKRFAFWSRKAKEYTYLYGETLVDEACSLTKYLGDAFHEGVRNIILDGEMVTWNPTTEKIDPFGGLKTAALNAKKEPMMSEKTWPMYRVFDVLYLNDQPLTGYTLRDRRAAMESAISKPVERRLELHQYKPGRSAADIEPLLRTVIAEGSEGLVLKNPRSSYHLNDRNDDWMKVKPEYMTGYGEDLDCLIIGGYYGSGRRGGNLSSFMCGLKAPAESQNSSNDKFWSFCKVGGGMADADFNMIRHQTDGKWQVWDRKNPPTHYIEISRKTTQPEQPDVWIRPSDSIVISIKAASIVPDAKLYRADITLRFPRFKSVRSDKKWYDALTFAELDGIKNERSKEERENQFTVEQRKRHASRKKVKREVHVAGAAKLEEHAPDEEVGAVKDLFEGFTFFVMSESVSHPKKTKAEIEAFAKAHGAALTQTVSSKASLERQGPLICVADRNVIKVRSLVKEGLHSIVRPRWLYDCAEQARRDVALGRKPLLLPWEPRHAFFPAEADQGMIGQSADVWSDGFACDFFDVDGVRDAMDKMPKKFDREFDAETMLALLQEAGGESDRFPGHMFKGYVAWFDDGTRVGAMDVDGEEKPPAKLSFDMQLASNTFRFACGQTAATLEAGVTHVILEDNSEQWKDVRTMIQSWPKLPHLVKKEWIMQSWAEQTLLDEDRFSC